MVKLGTRWTPPHTLSASRPRKHTICMLSWSARLIFGCIVIICTDSSDPEFQFKDEPKVESEGSKVKSKGKRKKRDSFAANVSSVLSQFAENGKRVDVLEKIWHGSLPGYSGVSGSASIGEMGLGPLAAGTAQCQELLNTMVDLDEDSYYKVLEKLHDDILWRQTFMDMPENRRLTWIKRL